MTRTYAQGCLRVPLFQRKKGNYREVIQTIQAGNTSNVIIAIASIESNACIKRNARCASGKRIAINAIDTSNVTNVSKGRPQWHCVSE